MSDVTDTDIQPADTSPGAEDVDQPDTPESDNPDATPEVLPGAAEKSDDADTFPREVVEELRRENGKYRQRAGQADELAKRLHLELVKATGRLADPTDLEFDESHLDDPDKLVAAIDELLGRKPHLATRKPAGDIGQGHRGGAPQPVSLLQILKDAT